MCVIATTIGVALFRLLPHRLLDGVVARDVPRRGRPGHPRSDQGQQEEAALVEREAASGSTGRHHGLHRHLPGRMGRPDPDPDRQPGRALPLALSVGVGALLALWAVAALAVIGGQSILRIVNIRTLRIVTAVVLLVLAGYAGWQAVR